MMRRVIRLFILAIILSFGRAYAEPVQLDSIFTVLDQTIQHSAIYMRNRQEKIDRLTLQFGTIPDNHLLERYEFARKIEESYRSVSYDSCFYYNQLALGIALKLKDSSLITMSKARCADLLCKNTNFLEGISLIKETTSKGLNLADQKSYFRICRDVYKSIAFYTPLKEISVQSYAKSDTYRDSLRRICVTDSLERYRLKETEGLDQHNYSEALAYNQKLFDSSFIGTPEYSMEAYLRAIIYRGLNRRDMTIYWLAVSSVSDIRSGIQDHASLWMLAQMLSEDGQTAQAYRYIQFSWQLTKAYNGKLRVIQMSSILSAIMQDHNMIKENAERRMYYVLVIISLLVLLLLAAMGYTYRQKKHLALAQKQLMQRNEELGTLNINLRTLNLQLDQTNLELASANKKLLKSNKMRIHYIGQFLELCAFHIHKMTHFRHSVLTKSKYIRTADLVKYIKSTEFSENELDIFYKQFDQAFLNLYPTFVSQFNDLLSEEHRILMDESAPLTTELRIFALIRIGISESKKIAEFLNYAPNTIYNYRARIKKYALNQEVNFEDLVMEIK